MNDIAKLRDGMDVAEAEALFDSLPPVSIAETLGSWHGSEIPTGHPMDGLLDISGWHGKEFASSDQVHPLVFGQPGALFAVNPRLIPLGLLNRLGARLPRWLPPGLRPAFRMARTSRPRARLREVSYRGQVSAAMVYDDLPIIDHFRRFGPDVLLGAMDMRDSPRPYFFLLERG